MALRIAEDPAALDAAYTQLQAALAAWAGKPAHAWTASGGLEPGGEGASYARRDDLHLYLERTRGEVAVGVALTERDRDLLRLDFDRAQPAKRRRKLALAIDDAQKMHLLIAADELTGQDIRDPFRRLAGAALAKRADVGGRDYLLLGPLDAPRVADALVAVAGLSPAFEKHISALGSLVADEDEAMDDALYAVSRNVARAHKVERRVIAALHEKLSQAGYYREDVETGPLKADFAMTRGAETLVFEIRGHAAIADFVRGVGQVSLVAPRAAAFTRFFVLPAPQEDLGAELAPFAHSFEELSLNVLFYDIEKDDVRFFFNRVDPALSAEARALFV